MVVEQRVVMAVVSQKGSEHGARHRTFMMPTKTAADTTPCRPFVCLLLPFHHFPKNEAPFMSIILCILSCINKQEVEQDTMTFLVSCWSGVNLTWRRHDDATRPILCLSPTSQSIRCIYQLVLLNIDMSSEIAWKERAIKGFIWVIWCIGSRAVEWA